MTDTPYSAAVQDGLVVNLVVGSAAGLVPAPDDVAIGWRYDGKAFSPPEAPEEDIGATRASLLARIDERAEAERLRWITPGTGQAMTYSRKVEEACAVVAADDPQASDYPMLSASIGIDGDDIAAVANVILAKEKAWSLIGAAIEGRRMRLKRDVADAPDSAALAAIDIATGWPDA